MEIGRYLPILSDPTSAFAMARPMFKSDGIAIPERSKIDGEVRPGRTRGK
jgi:hypothetical protein